MRQGQRTRIAAVAAAALALAVAPMARAEAPAAAWVPPAPSPELKAAMDKADAGDFKPLQKLAEVGHADAQRYAGAAFLSGRKGAPHDPRRGCALEEKASASRPDAMFLVGDCRRLGLAGPADPAGAKAAYQAAAARNYVPAKCALGQMLLAEPANAARGLALCQEGGLAGDVTAQLKVADAYRYGTGAKRDPNEARRWYEMAAAKNNGEASRKLGEMYAAGEGGKKDRKKAAQLWIAAEKAGDNYTSILMGDQLFSEITGGKQPGPGKFAFRGGVPLAEVESAISWYEDAQKRDPRPETQKRAGMALHALNGFKTAAKVKVDR
jgi:TPR repeat protein